MNGFISHKYLAYDEQVSFIGICFADLFIAQVLFDLFQDDMRLWKAYSFTLQVFVV